MSESTNKDNRAEFIATVLAASEAGTLEYYYRPQSYMPFRKQEPNKPVLKLDFYGGARMDRVHDRQDITNALGFPKASGSYEWSVLNVNEKGNGSSNPLGYVMSYYGKDYYFAIDGVPLPFHSDVVAGGKRGCSDIKPIHWDGPDMPATTPAPDVQHG